MLECCRWCLASLWEAYTCVRLRLVRCCIRMNCSDFLVPGRSLTSFLLGMAHSVCVCVEGGKGAGTSPPDENESTLISVVFSCAWPCACYVTNAFVKLGCRWRPYRVECTGSLPTSEVKRRRARLVLGWGTAREDLRVLPAFSCLTRLSHVLVISIIFGFC